MIKLNLSPKGKKNFFNIKVRVIKAPLVDSRVLREVLAQRQRALML